VTEDRAEAVAIAVLGWLAGEDEVLSVFLGSTGASAEDLRAQAGDPAFLASVLEFVTMDDDWVRAACDGAGLAYTDPMAARAVLAGPAGMHWT